MWARRWFCLVVLLVLAACSTIDAPSFMVRESTFHAVGVRRAIPPYDVTSVSRLRGHTGAMQRGTALDTEFHLLQAGCHRSWCWQVQAGEDVLRSWLQWLASPAAAACPPPAGTDCPPLDWNLAFERMFAVAADMLEDEPPPLDARIRLIPAGQVVEHSERVRDTAAIPLRLVFPYPTSLGGTSHDTGGRSHALVEAVTTVLYEYQHVLYASGLTRGPQSPRAARALKDEGNSACWNLVAQRALAVEPLAGHELGQVDAVAFSVLRRVYGDEPRYETAALWGPLLVWNAVGFVDGPVAGGSHGEVDPESLEAWCRMLTRYAGPLQDFVDQHLFHPVE